MSLMRLDHRDLPTEQARTVARAITDYDPELQLVRLPDGHPYLLGQPDKPYAIVHRYQSDYEHIIENFPESMLDERLLAIVAERDIRRAGGDLSKLDLLNSAYMVTQARARAERDEAARDLIDFHSGRRRSFS